MDKIQENIINIDEKNDNILKSQEKNVPNLDKIASQIYQQMNIPMEKIRYQGKST